MVDRVSRAVAPSGNELPAVVIVNYTQLLSRVGWGMEHGGESRRRMTDKNSVSGWIEAAKQGDETSIRRLWERYRQRVLRLASRKLQGSPRRVADEEDVALSAFARFCLGMQEGRFPRLERRDDLWRLLAKITVEKSLDYLRKEQRLKRGEGRVRGDSAFLISPEESGRLGLEQILCDAPTPELAASFAEECGNLLESLDDERLQEIAIGKLEGYTNAELAERYGCAVSTIGRALHLIRRKWQERQT